MFIIEQKYYYKNNNLVRIASFYNCYFMNMVKQQKPVLL